MKVSKIRFMMIHRTINGASKSESFHQFWINVLLMSQLLTTSRKFCDFTKTRIRPLQNSQSYYNLY